MTLLLHSFLIQQKRFVHLPGRQTMLVHASGFLRSRFNCRLQSKMHTLLHKFLTDSFLVTFLLNNDTSNALTAVACHLCPNLSEPGLLRFHLLQVLEHSHVRSVHFQRHFYWTASGTCDSRLPPCCPTKADAASAWIGSSVRRHMPVTSPMVNTTQRTDTTLCESHESENPKLGKRSASNHLSN